MSEKSVRLTKRMRDDFVAAVMADVPRTDFITLITDEFQKRVMAALPIEIQKLVADPNLIAYVHRPNVTARVALDAKDSVWVSAQGIGRYDANRELFNTVVALHAPACVEQHQTHAALRSKLAGIAAACATVKQLRDALPEFEKYLPKQEAATNPRHLPVVANVVSEFVKAGWPKGGAK